MSVDIRTRLPSARNVTAALGLMLLVAALVPFLIFAVPQVVGADHSFVILSGSMEPTASPGDVVIVDASAAIGVGDVITFNDGNTAPTTHRIVGIENGQYITQGDANQNPDTQPVAPSDVLGRVTLTIPFVGHVLLWANTPTGYVSLVVAPLVLLVATELFAWVRRDSERPVGDDEETSPVPKPVLRGVARTRGDGNDSKSVRAPTLESNSTTPAADDGSTAVTVAVADLKLTALALVALVGYAAWNVYREVTTVATPNAVSVAVLTGGILGLGFAAWVTVTAWLATDTTTEPSVSEPQSRTDGGTEEKR